MREIKFRGWNGKKWVYGYLATSPYGTPYIGRLAKKWSSVRKETVGQYTGMKDCNGTEIYEGDIVFDSDECGVVEWDESKHMFIINHESGWCNPMCEYYSDDLRVHGNRYDNPETLGGDTDE